MFYELDLFLHWLSTLFADIFLDSGEAQLIFTQGLGGNYYLSFYTLLYVLFVVLFIILLFRLFWWFVKKIFSLLSVKVKRELERKKK